MDFDVAFDYRLKTLFSFLTTSCFIDDLQGSRPNPVVETLSDDNDDDDASIDSFDDDGSIDELLGDSVPNVAGDEKTEEQKPIVTKARKKPSKYKKNPNAPKRFRR